VTKKNIKTIRHRIKVAASTNGIDTASSPPTSTR
jgi:hypothetical protein